MAPISSTPPSDARSGAPSAWRKHGQYEYRVLTIDRGVSVPDARKMLTDEAEYGRWELARTRLYMGGERRVWLRRKIIKVNATF
ncbi:DUF5703 family protein [Isoptericola sp. NPDC019693]|uniref:DUF5703 family protein n=1 Tax=Isoptericola sp. NPDC019693 TaxID=3364009 RepID=UPI00379834F4